ncbi:MAG: DUF4921 family protein [Actinobacteria bacterium]|jgi:UDPglucose--hexose-1-phosphate uridylyltransferase|nr:DUF4921 family protein [Actinomycetota bacterium]
MGELRLDPLTGRWVVIDPKRIDRPFSFAPRIPVVQSDQTRPCPFCPGNEDATSPVLETYSTSGKWLVRVVANRYPAFEGDGPFVVDHRGPVFTQATAGGIHEVLVLSPDHRSGWDSVDSAQSSVIMAAIRDRMEHHALTPGIRYSQALVNAGREAGASIEHPHAQLMAIPFVPRELADEQAGFARFAGRCVLCTTVDVEVLAGHRLVYADDRVIVVCPFWSGTPFEMLIIPRTHSPHLHRSTPQDASAVATAIGMALHQLREHIGDVSYNIVFHSAPYRAPDPFHWHVHILPKLTTVAGFELGTGVLINVVAPEDATHIIRLSAAA